MPYDIRKMGSKYCVVKRDGGKKMGCHPSRAKAVRQLRAIMASEHKNFHPVTAFKMDGQRYMLLVSTNGFKDREGEYVSQYAMRDEINRQWDEDGFHGDNVMKFWHAGPPIGDIIWADQEGAFTIEVARERTSGSPLIQAYTTAIWDYLEQGPDEPYGASIGYAYRDSDKTLTLDSESAIAPLYQRLRKSETSPLPTNEAANPYTFSGVIEMTTKRDQELDKILGKSGILEPIRRLLSGAQQDLENEGKEAKQFSGKTTITRQDMVDMVEFGVKSVMDKAVELAAETKDGDDTPATVDMDAIIGEVVDTFMTVPTVDLEIAADILAVNDADAPEAEAEGEDAHAHAESGEHAADGAAPVNDKALEAVIELNKSLTNDQAEIVKALQAVVPELAKVAGLSEQVKALKTEVARLNDEFKHRPRASVAAETVSKQASERVQEYLEAEKQAEDNFFPKATGNGA